MPRLVAFTGPAGVGKSTAARSLVDGLGFTRIGFADPLKAMLAIFLDCAGQPAETTAEMLQGDLKGVPAGVLCHRSARHAMQTLGAEWGRQCMHPDFWVQALARRIEARPDAKFVIDDLRFENEAHFVRARGGLVIALREASPWFSSPAPGNSSRAHESEAGIPLRLCDGFLVNDRGPAFARRVREFVRHLGGRP